MNSCSSDTSKETFISFSNHHTSCKGCAGCYSKDSVACPDNKASQHDAQLELSGSKWNFWNFSYLLCNNKLDVPLSPKDSLEKILKSSRFIVSVFCNEISPNESVPSSESWISGGPLGSRNTVLIFKSRALANTSEASIRNKPAYNLNITYKVLQTESKLLSKLLDCHGLSEVAPNSSDFNLLWTGSHPKPGTIRSLAPHQRVNHFPRSYELTRKDRLYKNIERMQHANGLKNFDFIPQTFVMPIGYRDLCSAHHRVKGPWIVKPVASSRGRGIYIVENPNQVPLEEPVVVAKYISNPLLVAGHKCDLRLYVVVSNFDPLLIYIYEEGLVRFATVKYDGSHKQLWNPCMHLCNYSINKYHSDYVKSDDPSVENIGHKWTLSALLRHLKSEGTDTALLMSQIEDMIIKAILSCANSVISACKMFVPFVNNCFELYGFDILIDKTLKPWLLEVNLSPSLNCDSPLDVRLKSAMLADLLTLIGIPAVDPIVRINEETQKSNMSIRSNSLSGRRAHSANRLGIPSSRATSRFGYKAVPPAYTADEAKIIRLTAAEFRRRGGFVRIFPSADSWLKYSQYLDKTTGIPQSGNPGTNFCLNSNHNYNLLIYTHFFPDISVAINPADKYLNRIKTALPRNNLYTDSHKDSINRNLFGRHGRLDKMVTEGHKSVLGQGKITKETQKKIFDLLQSGRRLTRWQARKTFSHYLASILKRIEKGPQQDSYVEIVLKFMQKASNYLKTPFNVKPLNQKIEFKDKAAVVAKQLKDFLYLYNRETELFVDKNVI